MDENLNLLPSPEVLKRKVLVKAKKVSPGGKAAESDSEDEGRPEMGQENLPQVRHDFIVLDVKLFYHGPIVTQFKV